METRAVTTGLWRSILLVVVAWREEMACRDDIAFANGTARGELVSGLQENEETNVLVHASAVRRAAAGRARLRRGLCVCDVIVLGSVGCGVLV